MRRKNEVDCSFIKHVTLIFTTNPGSITLLHGAFHDR